MLRFVTLQRVSSLGDEFWREFRRAFIGENPSHSAEAEWG
jgi:hypothetical protein